MGRFDRYVEFDCIHLAQDPAHGTAWILTVTARGPDGNWVMEQMPYDEPTAAELREALRTNGIAVEVGPVDWKPVSDHQYLDIPFR